MKNEPWCAIARSPDEAKPNSGQAVELRRDLRQRFDGIVTTDSTSAPARFAGAYVYQRVELFPYPV